MSAHKDRIAPEECLLLLACSGLKSANRARAIDLYQGVMYQTLRTHLNPKARPQVMILSALHGFIDPYDFIEPYDQMMTPDRAVSLMAIGLTLSQWPQGIRHVFMAGGANYRLVMQDAVRKLRLAGAITKDVTVAGTEGGIGNQRAQLGEYLRSLPVSRLVVGRHPNGTPLYRTLGGFSVGDRVRTQYHGMDEGEEAVVEELFFGPSGPTASVQMVDSKTRGADCRRWVGLRKLVPGLDEDLQKDVALPVF